MELKEFIKTTLVEIKNGLHEANLELAKQEGKTLGVDYTAPFVLDSHDEKGNRFVHYDVAVTTTQESTKSGGGKIQVAVFSAGGDVGAASKNEHLTRLRFSVRIHQTTG